MIRLNFTNTLWNSKILHSQHFSPETPTKTACHRSLIQQYFNGKCTRCNTGRPSSKSMLLKSKLSQSSAPGCDWPVLQLRLFHRNNNRVNLRQYPSVGFCKCKPLNPLFRLRSDWVGKAELGPEPLLAFIRSITLANTGSRPPHSRLPRY